MNLITRHRRKTYVVLSLFLAISLGAPCLVAQIPEQYPKPLLHTPGDHPAQHILLVVVDGLSAESLASFVKTHPSTTLAKLSARGVTYTNARVPWADPAAALMTIASGGSPISTGIFSSHGYDRALRLKGCGAEGVALDFSAASAVVARGSTGCGSTAAHTLVRVNSIFDLVHGAGGRTAWVGDNAADADMLRGPSGSALDDVFVAAAAPSGMDAMSAARMQDKASVDAATNWVARAGTTMWIMGVALTEFAAAQDSVPMSRSLEVSDARAVDALAAEDQQIGTMVSALTTANLNDSTWIVVTARFGGRGERANLRVVDARQIEKVARDAGRDDVDRVVAGTAGLVWLRDADALPKVIAAYRRKMAQLGIGAIYYGESLRPMMNTSATDSRMPDIVLEPAAGVQWSRNGRWSERLSGFSEDQNHVAMLISGRQLAGREDKTPVPTGQLAPLMVRMLGMEKFGLDALHKEHVPALPGIF